MRPGDAGVQHQWHAGDHLWTVETATKLERTSVASLTLGQPEAAAGQIGLVVARSMEVLPLQGGGCSEP